MATGNVAGWSYTTIGTTVVWKNMGQTVALGHPKERDAWYGGAQPPRMPLATSGYGNDLAIFQAACTAATSEEAFLAAFRWVQSMGYSIQVDDCPVGQRTAMKSALQRTLSRMAREGLDDTGSAGAWGV